MELFRLDHQISFVTGAGSGIGQKIAVGLVEAGAKVGCLDLPGSPGIKETIERSRFAGGRRICLLVSAITINE